MRKPVTIALLLTLCSVTLLAQTGSWHAYMSYYEPQQIVNFDGQLFIRASNDLYSYRLADHSITTYDKIHQLSDTYITQIALNKQAHKLLIVYENQNLDLIDANGEVSNISALYLKSMTEDKTVNIISQGTLYSFLMLWVKCDFIWKNVVISSDNSDAIRICVESLFKRILRINSVSVIYLLNLTLYGR